MKLFSIVSYILTQMFIFMLTCSVSVFLSTLAKPEFRLATLVGSCTAWSMEFSLMAKCPATKLSAEEMIPSTHFSARPERENTFLALCLLTWNQPSSVSYLDFKFNFSHVSFGLRQRLKYKEAISFVTASLSVRSGSGYLFTLGFVEYV